MLQVTTQREDVPYYKLSTSYAAATYCGFFCPVHFSVGIGGGFFTKFFPLHFYGKIIMINISKNVIKPAFTVRCCSSNKCETLAISIFSRLGIECKSTSKFVCWKEKVKSGYFKTLCQLKLLV